MKNRNVRYVLMLVALIATLFLPAWYVTGPDVPTNAVSPMAIMFNMQNVYMINAAFAIPVVYILVIGIILLAITFFTKKDVTAIIAAVLGIIAGIACFVCGLIAIYGYGPHCSVVPLGYLSMILVFGAAIPLFNDIFKSNGGNTGPVGNYIEFSTGAISIDGNKLTVYHNWLPFSFFKFGRIERVIYINDISSVVFKGPGFLPGTLCFYFKHFNFSHRVLIFKHFFWRRISFNKKMTPFYQELLKAITDNNK